MDDGAGANWCFVNGTVGVNSQSQKNRGKITISIQNNGTRAPKLLVLKFCPVKTNLVSELKAIIDFLLYGYI